MGSAAPALDTVPEPIDHDADRSDVAGYPAAGAAEPSAPEPRPLPDLQAQLMPAIAAAEPQMQRLQNAVLQALSDGNQHILVSMLSAGEWSVRGNELVIKIGESQTVVEMSISSDARRLAIASASGVLGRAMKLTVVPGAAVTPQENKRSGGAPRASGPGGRGRAEQDPVVRRMQEKFGAQVRTVIDYKEKR
jgi:DNA polymerase-3 subunit gamma/tau